MKVTALPENRILAVIVLLLNLPVLLFVLIVCGIYRKRSVTLWY